MNLKYLRRWRSKVIFIVVLNQFLGLQVCALEIEYKDVTSDAIYVTFAAVEGNKTIDKGTKFMIWTTTPWTLPANLAISVHPLFEYGLYDSDLGKVILLVSLEEEVSKETV